MFKALHCHCSFGATSQAEKSFSCSRPLSLPHSKAITTRGSGKTELDCGQVAPPFSRQNIELKVVDFSLVASNDRNLLYVLGKRRQSSNNIAFHNITTTLTVRKAQECFDA